MAMKDISADEIAFAECFISHYLDQDAEYLSFDKKTQDIVRSLCGALIVMLLKQLDIKVVAKKRVSRPKKNVAKA